MALSEIPGGGTPYIELQWQLNDVPLETIVLSNFIEFRGLKMIRLSIRNLDDDDCKLSVFAHELHQVGIHVNSVICKVDNFAWIGTTQHGCQPTVIFTGLHKGSLRGNHTIKYRVLVGHTIENYEFLLRDRLLNQQLWMSACNGGCNTDMNVRVQDNNFAVHKSLISTRSPALFAELKRIGEKQIDNSTGRARITLTDYDVESFTELITYLYTGECRVPKKDSKSYKKMITSFELHMLEELYTNIHSRKELLKPADLIELLTSLEVTPRHQPLPLSYPSEEARINQTGFVIHINDSTTSAAQGNFKFKNNITFGWRSSTSLIDAQETTLHLCFFSCLNVKCDLYVCDVICRYGCTTLTLNERHPDEDCALQIFDTKIPLKSSEQEQESISFEIFVQSRVENIKVELVDTLTTEQLWKAAKEKEMTDVEFLVDGVSFSAHQWIVAARSSVFADIFSDLLLEDAANCDVMSSEDKGLKESLAETPTTKITKIEIKDMHPNIFHELLYYIYTGVPMGDITQSLLAAAKKYQILTLVDLCNDTLRELDFEKLSFKLLSY